MLAASPSAQSSYRDENRLRIGDVLGNRIDAEIDPKAPSEKAQTTVSENRYIYPRINFFSEGHLLILASTMCGRHPCYSMQV